MTDIWSFTRGDTRIRRYTPPIPTGSPPDYLPRLLLALQNPAVAKKAHIKGSADYTGILGKLLVRVTDEGVEVELPADLSKKLPNTCVSDVQFSWLRNGVLQVCTLVRIELRADWQVTM